MKIEVEALVDVSPKRKRNVLRWSFADTTADVLSAEGKEKLGEVVGVVGGGIVVRDVESGYSFYISPQTIWSAIQEAKPKLIAEFESTLEGDTE